MLAPRFYDATSGEVRVFGRDVREYSLEALRGMFGFVMQKNRLFRGSVRDNMRFGAENASDGEIEEALKLAQAWDFVSEKGGLDAEIEQGGANLSGGQAQRLCIARALVRRPKILVFDDSSSALDYATDARLRAAIGSLDYSPAAVTVSQRVSTVMHCDRIIVLEDGRCAGIGTHDELMERSEEYREIYQSQIKTGEGK